MPVEVLLDGGMGSREQGATMRRAGCCLSAVGGIAGPSGRHWLPHLAYSAARARSVRPCVRGWAYAAANLESRLTARCRGRPINLCTNIMRFGFGPPCRGGGGLDASGLPRLVVTWEADEGGRGAEAVGA